MKITGTPLLLAACAAMASALPAISAQAEPALPQTQPSITFGRGLDIQGTPFLLSIRLARPGHPAATQGLSFSGVRPHGLPLRTSAISSGFGMRLHPLGFGIKFHGGLDFPAPAGTSVYATAPGKVVFAGWNGGYGLCLLVDHGAGVTTLFGHLSAVAVNQGDTINRGQIIGVVGSTGRSTGPHLHYEVRQGGQPMDPRPFL